MFKVIEREEFYTVERGTYQEHYFSLYELLLSYEGQNKNSLSILN